MLPTWESKFELKPGVWVFVPTRESVEEGNIVKGALSDRWKPPKNYFHLRSGGHVKALELHRNNTVFVHLDIQDFFGSIGKSRVTRNLKGFFSYEEARAIATKSTVTHPDSGSLILPFGFVQSPILASLCLAKSALGLHLQALPQKYAGLAVSVYVDDIILSSHYEADLVSATAELKEISARSRFILNPNKEQGPAHRITAFNVVLSNLQLEIEQNRYDRFVAAFNNSENGSQREGIFSYVASINMAQAVQLEQAYKGEKTKGPTI
ncbi:hypothetical protein FHW67_002536 [Herbaspirillum sp. Sphag1AN]|uniref:reverse transcriptase domain-containing protein n=1 Tax=unclassified Herbaspirillum TaxID=2624150 RepID=UPI00161F2A6C|nr:MULTISPECIES: reverse transcriptase domain-containing protein [unclassified Herbaspirillum]MBB3213247.1 hypothetical protein [Herbaspirillum sp. Sphag1AN]MBB3246444.1 hypothetical protein [Herbaspirillum sp. Sphag64]